ncbi:hypothetical protein Tco_1540361, partial [Tanacetum coccineum]
ADKDPFSLSRTFINDDEDPTYEDGDIRMGDSTGVSTSLGGEIFSGGKKCQEIKHWKVITWTTEEEIALAKGWVAISENSKHGNARKQDGFWCETVRPAVIRFCGVYGNVMRMAHECGAGDEDYVQGAIIHYQAEIGLPFKFRHCWDVLKDKFEDASINLNTNVGDNDEDEVNGTEITTHETKKREIFLEIKRREVECREREVAAQEYRQEQEDIRFYLQPYDHFIGDQRREMDEVRAKIKAKYNFQY